MNKTLTAQYNVRHIGTVSRRPYPHKLLQIGTDSVGTIPLYHRPMPIYIYSSDLRIYKQIKSSYFPIFL